MSMGILENLEPARAVKNPAELDEIAEHGHEQIETLGAELVNEVFGRPDTESHKTPVNTAATTEAVANPRGQLDLNSDIYGSGSNGRPDSANIPSDRSQQTHQYMNSRGEQVTVSVGDESIR